MLPQIPESDASAVLAHIRIADDPHIITVKLCGVDFTSTSVCYSESKNVRELHIDLLLEEEFIVNPLFLRQFLLLVGLPCSEAMVRSVDRSVADAFGETDLLVIYESSDAPDSPRLAILIENKVRASFQPGQAARYRLRGDAGIGKTWDKYWTCLIAPESYVAGANQHRFDVSVNLEELKSLLAPNDSERANFKRKVIEDAIVKAHAIGPQQIDEAVTDFRAKYYACFSNFFAGYEHAVTMTLPAVAWKGEVWFRIKCCVLPKGAYVMHKAPHGYVDLAFPKTDASLLKSAGLELSGASIVQTGKSASIRLLVKPITDFNSFEVARPSVEDAFHRVRTLLDLFILNQASITRILSGKRSIEGVPQVLSKGVGG